MDHIRYNRESFRRDLNRGKMSEKSDYASPTKFIDRILSRYNLDRNNNLTDMKDKVNSKSQYNPKESFLFQRNYEEMLFDQLTRELYNKYKKEIDYRSSYKNPPYSNTLTHRQSFTPVSRVMVDNSVRNHKSSSNDINLAPITRSIILERSNSPSLKNKTYTHYKDMNQNPYNIQPPIQITQSKKSAIQVISQQNNIQVNKTSINFNNERLLNNTYINKPLITEVPKRVQLTINKSGVLREDKTEFNEIKSERSSSCQFIDNRRSLSNSQVYQSILKPIKNSINTSQIRTLDQNLPKSILKKSKNSSCSLKKNVSIPHLEVQSPLIITKEQYNPEKINQFCKISNQEPKKIRYSIII